MALMECAFNSRERVIFLISFEIKVRTCSCEKKEKQNFYIIPTDITCSNSTIKVIEQGMKYVQSKKERPQNNIIELVLDP